MNRHLCLKKLEILDIRGVTNKWFKSFLKGRKQYTTIQGKKHGQNLTDYGVINSSILGPDS